MQNSRWTEDDSTRIGASIILDSLSSLSSVRIELYDGELSAVEWAMYGRLKLSGV